MPSEQTKPSWALRLKLNTDNPPTHSIRHYELQTPRQGRIYTYGSLLGEGIYDSVYSFFNPKSSQKFALVCGRKNYDEHGLSKKRRFFEMMYGKQQVHLFQDATHPEHYVLTTPQIPGLSLSALFKIYTPNAPRPTPWELLYALCNMLKICHKRLVYLDLKSPNIMIHQHENGTWITHLIDGDLSCTLTEQLPSNFNISSDNLTVRQNSPHIAPECWHENSDQAPLAHPSMDIYAIANLFNRSYTSERIPTPLKALLTQCGSLSPQDRPSIDALLHACRTELNETSMPNVAMMYTQR